VITPRRTRLIRAADLRAWRRIIQLVDDGDRDRVILVSNRAGAEQLSPGGAGARALTREELYQHLHNRLFDAPRLLTGFEREAIAQAAALEGSRDVPDLTFRIRPTLVAEILRFYDQLKRQSQTVTRFAELIVAALGTSGDDRGADRMLRQTRFIERTLLGYERRLEASGALDEHLLRRQLIADAGSRPLRHIVVTVADWIAEPNGLFVADFDLLTRLPGLEMIDVICTETLLGSGFHQRLHEWLPGIEEVAGTAIGGDPPAVRPVLRIPAGSPPEQPWFVRRDREEELVAIARLHGTLAGTRSAPPPESPAETAGQLALDFDSASRAGTGRVAVVYKRPLPYLYLAPPTLGAAGIRYHTADALPLAAEPTAAALDLVFDAVETGFSRESLIALLRTPHFSLTAAAFTPAEIRRLDYRLTELRYLGDRGVLETLVTGWTDPQTRAVAQAALAIASRLASVAAEGSASSMLNRLGKVLGEIWRAAEPSPYTAREERARSAIDHLLAGLAAAYAHHHDPDWTFPDLAATVRRALQETTFAVTGDRSPHAGHAELFLIDDQAARYGEFEHMHIVGLIENDWPERTPRNIFYPASLLKALGWPSEQDRRAAADAQLLDLLGSASQSVSVSVVTLEDDALVTRSVQLDEIPRARLATVVEDDDAHEVFADDVVAVADRLSGQPGHWVKLRTGRPSFDEPPFHGRSGPTGGTEWSISALETYLDCPFKFFARNVLKLEEEPEDEEVVDPRRQGQFVHAVFEEFFRVWQKSGHGAITAANIDSARALFESVVESQLERSPLSDAEAALERTRLLGSPAASGLGEAVFRMEAERPVAVVERLLEFPVGGEVAVPCDAGPRTVTLRGKADRIDLLDDGTFRLIDYKLGWPPDRSRALQLPMYGLLAEQRLRHHGGRGFVLGEAAYLAFKGPRRVVPLFTTAAQRADVMAKAQDRLVRALEGIGRGDFPPSPDDVYRCETCAFAAVCRKDYVDS
jgi:RecB family exonuclease